MAKIIQIIQVDSDGYRVRLDDGTTRQLPHGDDHPHIGQHVPGSLEAENLELKQKLAEAEAALVELRKANEVNADIQAQLTAAQQTAESEGVRYGELETKYKDALAEIEALKSVAIDAAVEQVVDKAVSEFAENVDGTSAEFAESVESLHEPE